MLNRTLRRGFVAFAFALLVSAPVRAWYFCIEQYSGGALCKVDCRYYDDEGNPTGRIFIDYNC